MNKTTKTTAITTATKKTATVKKVANSAKIDRILSMTEIIELAHKNGVCFYATENKSNLYRIFNGKSSLNIKKTMYVLYATPTDFDNIETAKIDGVKCERDKNSVDGVRPHKVTIAINAIDTVMKTLALNTKNRMQ